MRSDVLNSNSGSYGAFDFVQYSKDMAFATGRWQDLVTSGILTSNTKTDAEVDAGLTLAADNTYVSAWTSDATSAIALPAATSGTFIAWVQTGDADAANAMTISAVSGDTFEQYQEVHIGTGIPAQQDSSVAADDILTITPAATNGGWGQIGSTFMLYCKDNGKWLVKVNGVLKGDGSAGTIAFSS